MRTIIAGGRDIHNMAELHFAISQSWIPSVVISGGANGADRLGEIYAEKTGKPLEVYPADWGKYGKSAGPIRNREMANVAEGLIALWDGESRGTKHMIETARGMGLRVYVHMVPKKR